MYLLIAIRGRDKGLLSRAVLRSKRFRTDPTHQDQRASQLTETELQLLQRSSTRPVISR
jgi:hypothetical protein